MVWLYALVEIVGKLHMDHLKGYMVNLKLSNKACEQRLQPETEN